MLGALQLEPGLKVFESGTGTGWTAALMVQYVGDAGLVVSVEYDEALAARAQQNVRQFGGAWAIRQGDGEAGWPQLTAYDVTTATHAVWRIPKAWIDQTRPGGLLCAPVAVSDGGLDLFVRLTVREDGSASGPVLFPLAFMRSRSTEVRPPDSGWADDAAREGTTGLDLPAILEDGLPWVLRIAIPGITITGPQVEDGDDCVWLSLPDGSWAVAYVPAGKPWEDVVVEQHGPRSVWTEAEAAWAQWQAAGEPELDGYGLTVEADGTHRWWIGDEDETVIVLP
jgi:protein-L-isoaspartate O-methyltransferase